MYTQTEESRKSRSNRLKKTRQCQLFEDLDSRLIHFILRQQMTLHILAHNFKCPWLPIVQQLDDVLILFSRVIDTARTITTCTAFHSAKAIITLAFRTHFLLGTTVLSQLYRGFFVCVLSGKATDELT